MFLKYTQRNCTDNCLVEVTKLMVRINPINSNAENICIQKLKCKVCWIWFQRLIMSIIKRFSKAWSFFKIVAFEIGFSIKICENEWNYRYFC